MEPFQKKLGVDTWFYVKRCFLSLLESLSKHLIMIPDNVLYECLDFLDYCELYGKEIKARDVDPLRKGSFIFFIKLHTYPVANNLIVNQK